jgi:hypothetical protein
MTRGIRRWSAYPEIPAVLPTDCSAVVAVHERGYPYSEVYSYYAKSYDPYHQVRPLFAGDPPPWRRYPRQWFLLGHFDTREAAEACARQVADTVLRALPAPKRRTYYPHSRLPVKLVRDLVAAQQTALGVDLHNTGKEIWAYV